MADGAVAAMTLGISVYAAIILVCVGLGIHYMQRGRRRPATVCAVIVGVLTVAGLIIAIASSVV